jgi:hypothetical protein
MLRWALALWLIASTASAQSEHDNQEEAAKTRRVKGHVFLFPILQQNAFVTTHVGIREGFAVRKVPNLPVGRLGTRNVTLSGFQQSLDLGFRILEWVGVYGCARGVIITGVDADSLLVDGASFDFAMSGGGVFRLLKDDDTGTQLALRLRVGYSQGREIPIQPFVQALINSPVSELVDIFAGEIGSLIFVPTRETTFNGGLYLAQTIVPMLSVQLGASLEHADQTREPFDLMKRERIQVETSALRSELAAAVELTFMPLEVPVAVMAEFVQLLGKQTEMDELDHDLSTTSIGIGVYYVGRPNLQLGIGGVTTLYCEPRRGIGVAGNAQNSGAPTLAYGDLILRYIW